MMGWLDGLTNEQRRAHHKRQDPDQPHPYRPRRVTARRMPGAQWMLSGRWPYTKDWRAAPCRVCGGSEQLVVHQ